MAESTNELAQASHRQLCYG